MLDDALRRIRVARVAVAFEATACGPAPAFPGSAFRGALGRALRRAACATGAPACDGCPLVSRCAYGYLFETHVGAGARRMRLYPYAPHPMVLRPPPATPGWRTGDEIRLEVLLFGRGIDYLPFVLYALGAAGGEGVGPGRVPLRILRAELCGPVRRRIYDGSTLAPGPYGAPAEDHVGAGRAGDLSLSLFTPVRIVHQGSLARQLPLHVVVRSLARRVASLAELHEGRALDLDFRGIIDRAARVPARRARLSWLDQRRRSARQGRAQVLGGLTGEVEYADVPGDLAALLALGELTHVGKATVFGFGRYERRAA